MISENILILTNWPYSDALIQTYTLPYVKIIRRKLSKEKKLYFVTLEKNPIAPDKITEIKGELDKASIKWRPSSYSPYGLKAVLSRFFELIRLVFFCYKNRIKVIHIWCTPPGIQGYIVSLLTGVKLIIDSYEPHAEAMVENGTWSIGSFRFRVLFLFEKLMSRKASIVVSATEGMREYALEKYNAKFSRFYVKPACVNLSLFNLADAKNESLSLSLGLKDKIVLLYAGKFGGIYLGKEVFDFVKIASTYFGENFRLLLLTSHSQKEIDLYCKNAAISRDIIISKFVKHSEIPLYMGLADFAITPVKSVPSKRYCTPIKDGEYWAMGLPVVITKGISDDSEIIEKEGVGAVLTGLNEAEYKAAVEKIAHLVQDTPRQELRLKIRKIAEKYRSFEIAESIYGEIYN